MQPNKQYSDFDQKLLPLFISRYKEALPTIEAITKYETDDVQLLPLLLEARSQLPPILAAVKSMPHPQNGEFRKTKRDFEIVLDSCIKAGQLTLKLMSRPDAQKATVTNRITFGGVVQRVTFASELMKELPKRVASLLETGVSSQHFSSFVAEKLSSVLPFRKKYILFGPQVCELAALPPMRKAAFFIGGALSMADEIAGEDVLAHIAAPRRWPDQFQMVINALRTRADLMKGQQPTYDTAFPENLQVSPEQARTLLSPMECITLLGGEVLTGLLWGKTLPNTMSEMLKAWIKQGSSPRDLGVGGLKVQEHPILTNVEQAYQAAITLYQAWRELNVDI